MRCGACGAIGHMRTNKLCPKYTDNIVVVPEPDEVLQKMGSEINVVDSGRKIIISQKVIEAYFFFVSLLFDLKFNYFFFN